MGQAEGSWALDHLVKLSVTVVEKEGRCSEIKNGMTDVNRTGEVEPVAVDDEDHIV